MQSTESDTKDAYVSSTGRVANQDSSITRTMPTLSPRQLSIVLAFICVVPVLIIVTLFAYMPPVYEGLLEARITAAGLPESEFYEQRYDLRPEFSGGELVVENLSDQDWTHLNIQVNRHYQIHDVEPIKAHSSRRFDLERFITRTGARFNIRYNEINQARVYARRPTRDRATYACGFEKGQPVELPETLKAREREQQRKLAKESDAK